MLNNGYQELKRAGNGAARQERRSSYDGLFRYSKNEGHELRNDSDGKADQVDVGVLVSFVRDIFAVISSMKKAYAQLQAAHSPYDADKLRSADKAIIGEMRKLSELKHVFYEKHLKGSEHDYQRRASIGSFRSLDAEENPPEAHKSLRLAKLENEVKVKQRVMEAYEGYVEELQKEIKSKEEDNDQLRSSLQKAKEKIEILERGMGINVKESALSDSALCLQLFEATLKETKDAVSRFTWILLKLMKGSMWDIDVASQAIEPGVFYSKSSHRKFAFQSYLCHRMFDGFDSENFSMSASVSSILKERVHKQDCLLQFQDMRFIDPSELVNISPHCLFGKFCQRKYLHIIHQKMEEAFFEDGEQRSQVLNGDHPTTPFYKSFLTLTKSVWQLHLLAFAITPTISIFQVRKDAKFHPHYMESVVPVDNFNDGGVGLTVFPGFCHHKQIFKCQVYLYGHSLSD